MKKRTLRPKQRVMKLPANHIYIYITLRKEQKNIKVLKDEHA